MAEWPLSFENSPAGRDPATSIDDAIRATKVGIREITNEEHVLDPAVSSTLHGVHRLGSARVYLDSQAVITRPDGFSSLDIEDTGRIAIDPATRIPWVWSGTAWIRLLSPKYLSVTGAFRNEVFNLLTAFDLTVNETRICFGCLRGMFLYSVVRLTGPDSFYFNGIHLTDSNVTTLSITDEVSTWSVNGSLMVL